MRQYPLSTTGQQSFYRRGTENRILTDSESVAYPGTFPWSIKDLTVSYSGKDIFLMQMFIGNNKLKLQFVVLHFKNKVTNISGSADTYESSFALF